MAEKLVFLKREEIKTMAKDLAKLQEEEAIKEKERISKLKLEEKLTQDASQREKIISTMIPGEDGIEKEESSEEKISSRIGKTPPWKKVMVRILIVFSFIAFLFLIGFSYWYLVIKKKQNPQPSPTPSVLASPSPSSEESPSPSPTESVKKEIKVYSKVGRREYSQVQKNYLCDIVYKSSSALKILRHLYIDSCLYLDRKYKLTRKCLEIKIKERKNFDGRRHI